MTANVWSQGSLVSTEQKAQGSFQDFMPAVAFIYDTNTHVQLFCFPATLCLDVVLVHVISTFVHTKLVMLSLHNHQLTMFQDILSHSQIAHYNHSHDHKTWIASPCMGFDGSAFPIMGVITVYIMQRELETPKQLYLHYTLSTVIVHP